MKVLNYILTTLLLLSVGVFTSCSDDDKELAKACLASASSLQFGADDTSEKIITVYSDGDWVVEAPEWVTVYPTSGTGTMDVTVSVDRNYRDGSVDNPRKANLLFKGRNLRSIATVIISQDGDKYRDVKSYKVNELDALDAEAVVSVPEAIVVAVTSNGFIASNAELTSNVYFKGTAATAAGVKVGDNVSVRGTKEVEYTYYTYVDCDEVVVDPDGYVNVTYPAATDITDNLDNISINTRAYVSVEGKINGTNVTVDGKSNTVVLTDVPSTLSTSSLSGHNVKVYGYYAGTSAPSVRLIVASIEDLGVAEYVYFTEDFEWLSPWAEASSAGKTVENDDLSATAPQIVNSKVDDVSARDALLSKGYEFKRVTPSGETTSECIYLQSNYLKFGKTGYQAGIILPAISDIPADLTGMTLTFDWCPMRQGSGKVDPVTLVVQVINGDETIDLDTNTTLTHSWANDTKLTWINASVDLSNVKFTSESRIFIKQTQWGVSTANRWFLDNIKVSQPK
jgi:hypothetical protein